MRKPLFAFSEKSLFRSVYVRRGSGYLLRRSIARSREMFSNFRTSSRTTLCVMYVCVCISYERMLMNLIYTPTTRQRTNFPNFQMSRLVGNIGPLSPLIRCIMISSSPNAISHAEMRMHFEEHRNRKRETE